MTTKPLAIQETIEHSFSLPIDLQIPERQVLKRSNINYIMNKLNNSTTISMFTSLGVSDLKIGVFIKNERVNSVAYIRSSK